MRRFFSSGVKAEFHNHPSSSSPTTTPSLAAPPPPQSPSSCNSQKCPWWPYSNSREFKLNTALVFAFLVFAIIFALAFNIGIRYIITLHCVRRRRRRNPRPADRTVEIPSRIYWEGMGLAGTDAVCAICLSELVIGERISVVEKCNHGFHVECIQRWLASHSSCPTCRANCSPYPNTASNAIN